jgi:CheY-like chemotaxis protein
MSSSAASPQSTGFVPLSIAIADDMPEIQLLAREWLTSAGHHVMCVENGRELTRLAQERHLDLVVTDVMMPESDGFEVLADIKRYQPQIRVIVISGGGTVMDTNDCLRVAMRLGADAVLAKPFNRAQFMAMIEQVGQTCVIR